MYMFRRRKFMVYLPRRGGRRYLFSINAKDETEAESKILEEISTFDDPEVAMYKYLIVLDTKTNTEWKLENPLYDAETAREQRPQKPDLNELIMLKKLEIWEAAMDSFKTIIPQIWQVNIDIMRDMVRGMMEAEMRRARESSMSFEDLLEFIMKLRGIQPLMEGLSHVSITKPDEKPEESKSNEN